VRLNQTTKPLSSRVRFSNPPGSPQQTAGLADFVPFFLRRATGRPPVVPAGHVLPAADAAAALSAAGPESLTWLGHASFLIRTGGLTILTDPFLSDHASPVAGLGPRRFVPPGMPVDALPPVDAIVVSHNHYDHLDARTVEGISLKVGGAAAAVVPAGLGPFFASRGYSDVRELAWSSSTLLRKSPPSPSSSFPSVSLTCLPAIHFSGRTPLDRNATLWCSWSIVSPSLRLYFAGDTGYGPLFAGLGREHGPFDVALLPIGAYEPASIMRSVHLNPEEAVAVGRDLRASTLVAMHWGTIVLTDEPPFEPPGRFRAAARAAGYLDERAWVMKIGETRETR
jgi:L-ascorbate metabolism protein UlaG (beta-lactamase superfamily)